jgi:hypothetical protein
MACPEIVSWPSHATASSLSPLSGRRHNVRINANLCLANLLICQNTVFKPAAAILG